MNDDAGPLIFFAPNEWPRTALLHCSPSARAPDCLGYDYLGNWTERADNECIEAPLLRANLAERGYSDSQVSAALRELDIAADTTGTTLYQANLCVYKKLLRHPGTNGGG